MYDPKCGQPGADGEKLDEEFRMVLEGLLESKI